MQVPLTRIVSAFDGVFPSVIVTGDPDGTPNVANLSRVWHVEEGRVAVADQMLNKTLHNLAGNPFALIKLATPDDLIQWELAVRHIGTETEGPLFDRLHQDIRTVSWVAGVANAPGLRAALVFEVMSVRRCVEEALYLSPAPETYGELLSALAQELELDRCSYWAVGAAGSAPSLLASRGVPGAGTDPSAFDAMRRLAALVAVERRVIRLRGIGSQMRYMHTIESETGKREGETESGRQRPLPGSLLAFPVFDSGTLIGTVCCEEARPGADAFDRYPDDLLLTLADKLGEALETAARLPESDREPLFRQVVERAKLQAQREAEPFHTALSARERQVALHVAQGHTNADIAKILFVSTRTVTTHVERIFQKLHIGSRAALARYVAERKLLEEPNGPPPSQNT
ncbi:LuxR C-terminal-related transcriptional regulator [Paenibacillus flagellatus]|uniref:LuxR C-terminal-related transcriptional regulator n=1 Tax=Paenibacillus flagellatus TaxID=2211139 RepID=UPI0013052795|nr:LuxR C-terminal-related transcriptional regulator [Paenibacillus flagellatus]